MNEYLKNAGSALFYGNRTKPPFRGHINSDTSAPSALTPPGVYSYAYRYRKSDIVIQKRSNLPSTGGFIILNNVTPLAYESLEVGTGSAGSGDFAHSYITVSSGLFQNLDRITIGSKSVELRTDGTGNNDTSLNIGAGPLSTQINNIVSFLGGYYGSLLMPESGKLLFFTGTDFLGIRAKDLNTNANSVAIGLVSSNPSISITGAVSSPVNSKLRIQSVVFSAVAPGTLGNQISVTYTVGTTATNDPEVSVNAGNAIDVKLKTGYPTTAQMIIDAVNSTSSVSAIVSAELGSGYSSDGIQTGPVSIKFLDGGASFIMPNWIPGDKLKNCFIPAPKQMYGYNSHSANSFTLNEVLIGVNITMYQTYHCLQLVSHPSHNYGSWFRKNIARNATVRLDSTIGGANYSEFEMLPTGVGAGIAGNTYTFEIRDCINFNLSGQLPTNPRFFTENAGKRIVLQLGGNGSTWNVNVPISSMSHINQAFANGEPGLKNLFKLSSDSSSFYIEGQQSEKSFSGGTASAGSSNLVSEGRLDATFGSCRKSNFPGFEFSGEIGADGKSRISDDSGSILKSSGKFPGMFAKVVPSGTAFKASAYFGDLKATAVLGGVAGNSISILYTAGATAGAEVASISGNAISIQIADGVSTAEQVLAAIVASGPVSAKITARVAGIASSLQTVAMVSPAISLANGAAALSTDSGYFIMLRRNWGVADANLVNNGSQCYWEVMHSKDLSDPNSFNHVVLLEGDNVYEPTIAGTRSVIDIEDYRNSGVSNSTVFGSLPGNAFRILGANSSNVTPTTVLLHERNAHVHNNIMLIESKTKGTAGNKSLKLRVLSGGVLGSETVTVVGNLITITVAINQTTVAHVKTAVEASAANSLISVSPYLSNTLTSLINQTASERFLMGAVEFWQYEGLWGFGYCNINEYEFVPGNLNGATVDTRVSPRSYTNDLMMENFRLTKIN
jgi:hypothetical protein